MFCDGVINEREQRPCERATKLRAENIDTESEAARSVGWSDTNIGVQRMVRVRGDQWFWWIVSWANGYVASIFSARTKLTETMHCQFYVHEFPVLKN